ncbi:MAG: hypothetical protein WEB06_08990 [Actinomycetota bacterium]
MRRAAILLVLLLVCLSAGVAFAFFSDSSPVTGNTFSTKADWEAPTASESVVAKTVGYSAGYIKQGATYYVYANITDGGNPASGVSTATADVSTIDTGQTAVALASGSFSVEGVSYNRRSASLTANGTLSEGTYGYTVTMTDVEGNSKTQAGFSVVVDNTVPAASDIQTANGGSIVGRADIGDAITFTFSEPIDPNSILSGWDGLSTSVVVRLNDDGLLGLGSDSVRIYNSSNAAQLPLGSVDLRRGDYTSSNRTFGATGTPSTMVMSGNSITITLGTQSGAATTAGGNGNMSWTPSATATDRAGNACSTSSKTETGTADKEF